MEPESSLPYSQAQRGSISPMSISELFFHGEELLAPRPTPKLEDHPLSDFRDYLFNLFAATLHIGGHSSIRILRTRHAVVTGTHKHGEFSYTKQSNYTNYKLKSLCMYESYIVDEYFNYNT